jgi:hypothetical protein
MLDAAWALYLVTVILTSGYFLLTKRRFDFLTIAHIGAIFYFSPLFFGWVFQASPVLSETIPPTVYLIATMYLIALVAGGLLSTKTEPPALASAEPGRRLSRWYLLLALSGLVASFVSTRGAIINLDKMVVLSHVGYYYVLFEVAATLACISAVIERRWWELAAALLLLFIDLVVGFRVFLILAALSATLILLMRGDRLYLYRKLPTYGSAAVILLVAMLFANAIRPIVYDQVAKLEFHSTEPVGQRAEMQGGEANNSSAPSAPRQPQIQAPKKEPLPPLTFSNWKSVAFRLVQQSGEPFIVQGTLVAIVETGLSCSASNIFKSLFLLVPPGMARFAPTNSFPPTFFDEYQPILYPDIHHGTAGNIWAEMLCRFGYAGLIIFGALLILVLIGLNGLLPKSSAMLAAPLTLGGSIIAFYINRNDLHFTLQMLKWIGLVFLAAYLISFIPEMVRKASARL